MRMFRCVRTRLGALVHNPSGDVGSCQTITGDAAGMARRICPPQDGASRRGRADADPRDAARQAPPPSSRWKLVRTSSPGPGSQRTFAQSSACEYALTGRAESGAPARRARHRRAGMQRWRVMKSGASRRQHAKRWRVVWRRGAGAGRGRGAGGAGATGTPPRTSCARVERAKSAACKAPCQVPHAQE